ncbi:MAG TPA: TonB-dependent receptor [Pedomonas sp.]|uniref:TonB-dependent receptor n=1 Tax=Pedomonas sp. TaxID=2976421 RepID=UPI002F417087
MFWNPARRSHAAPLLRHSISGLATAAALLCAGGASAQQAAGGIEEIIVTAQRRAESLQETPISIVAFSEAMLENKSITGINDLTAQVPNLQLTPFPGNATTQRIYIRGIGSNNDQFTQDPSVAVYIDGVYVARSQGLATEVADLERIEVLRGPQGSLYGRNATGGAINFITSAPKLGAWSAKQTLSIGNLDHFRSRTLVNIPVGEQFAAQLSYFRSKRDGITENLGTGVKRFGDQDRTAYRASLLWQPAPEFELRYTYDRTEIDDTPAHAASVPLYPATLKRPKAGSPFVRNLQRNDIVSQGHNLTASWDLSASAQLKSITAFRKLDSFTNQDYLSGVFGPFAASFVVFDQKQEQFSQEVQLVGEIGERLNYALGAYYFKEDADGFDTAFQLASRLIERSIGAKNKAYAAYAQATYTPDVLEDRLHLTLGGRWSRDERQATFQRSVQVGALPPAAEPVGRGSRSFEDFSPSATLAFDVTDQVNTYARVATGYKTGGYNVGASSLQRFSEGFAPEDVISYELGLKSDLLNRTLRFNVALFRMDYKDIQVNVPDPLQPSVIDVINAGKARVQGVELDVVMRPSPDLNIALSYGYLDAKYTSIIDPAGKDITANYPYISAPKHNITMSLEYTFPPTPIGTVSAVADYSFQDKQYSQANDWRYIIGDYGLLNARLNLTDMPLAFADVRLGIWGRNLTGRDYYVAHGNLFAPGALYGEPRTYGIDLNLAF